MSTIRAFIAIQLPEKARNELARINEILAGQLPPRTVRWVKPELMHLTLRFLGDTAVSKLPAIYNALDTSSTKHAPFMLSLDHLGCFPNRKRPRVIWAGIQGELGAAAALKSEIDQTLLPLGWEKEERPFQPHLTIGRIKDSRKLQGINWQADIEKLALPVQAIHLIESELTPGGPIYTVRHTSQLQLN